MSDVSEPQHPAITVIGAGRIGLPVVERLVAAGHDVSVVDVRPEVADAAEKAGARWAGAQFRRTPARRVVMTVLPGNPELRDVMLGPDGDRGTSVLSALEPGDLWVDLTSAGPDIASELAQAARQQGVRYVEAAVGGGADDARRGRLALYVGGNSADVDELRPLLETVGDPDRIRHMGAHGAGYLTKLLINQLWFTHAVATGEALLLAAHAGIEPARLTAVLSDGPAASRFLDDYAPCLLAGDYLPAFPLARIVEELDSLQSAAVSQRLPWAVGSTVAEVHRQALERFGDLDGELLAVAHLERLAGRTLEARD